MKRAVELKTCLALGSEIPELFNFTSWMNRRHREYPVLAIRGLSDIVGLKRTPCDVAAAGGAIPGKNLPHSQGSPIDSRRVNKWASGLGANLALLSELAVFRYRVEMICYHGHHRWGCCW
jgi:hypothetical protein